MNLPKQFSLMVSRPFGAVCLSSGLIAVSVLAASAQTPGPSADLSLGEALQAALQRNFTVQMSRVDTEISGEAVRAYAGAYDPILSAEYGYTNVDFPVRMLEGVDPADIDPDPDSQDATLNLGISGVLPTGTRYYGGVSFSDSTDPFSTYNSTTGNFDSGDQVTSTLSLSITQPLLRGFRSNAYQSDLLIAKRQRDQSTEGFRAAVIDTVTSTVQAYHNLYFTSRNLEVAERNRANAAQLLADNRRRVEAGAMAPLDIYQAESEVAVRESAVIAARRLKRNAENQLKALIFDDPTGVLERTLTVPELPTPQPVEPDPQSDFATALARRPDYLHVIAEAQIRQTEIDRDRWAARPQLDVYASAGRYTSNHTLSESVDALDAPGTDRYSVGIVFSRPLFNRTNDATLAISHLRRNRTELFKRQLEQQILLDLDNAATGVIAAWQRVESTRQARDLAEKSLEAEEKKLQIGTSSTFVVLRLQGDLANAEIRELSAVVDYFTALADYESARGTTLEAFGLTLL